MVNSVFTSFPLQKALLENLLAAMSERRTLWGPTKETDDLWRLRPMDKARWPSLAIPTFIPVKKLLLPHHEEIWTWRNGVFCSASEPEACAVLGVPLCDLQAVWYLDQVFADDASYRTRRGQVLLVGMLCEPGPECRCDRQLMPVAGDLFVSRQRIWALSPAGTALLQAGNCQVSEDLPLPWPDGTAAQRPAIKEECYRSAADAAVWTEEAQRCLSCGACSAVCPTCYCFDMLDDADLEGSITRRRTWDNCFFAEHGKVAGGHDFRRGRAHRLRFRMEHKFFGFGALHLQNSCVGCGRCRKACPVDIDLDRIAERLAVEAAS